MATNSSKKGKRKVDVLTGGASTNLPFSMRRSAVCPLVEFEHELLFVNASFSNVKRTLTARDVTETSVTQQHGPNVGRRRGELKGDRRFVPEIDHAFARVRWPDRR